MYRFWSLSLIFIVSFLLLACGGEDTVASTSTLTQNKEDRPSYLELYLRDKKQTSKTPPLRLEDEWTALLACPAGIFPLQMKIESQKSGLLTGVLAIDPAINNNRKQSPFQKSYLSRPFKGTYTASTQLIEVIADAENQPEQSGHHYKVILKGSIAPDQKNKMVFAIKEYSANRAGRACGMSYMARQKDATHVKRAKETITTLIADRSPVTQTTCPASYRQWLDQVTKIKPTEKTRVKIYRLLEDEYFIPTFGRAFHEMDAVSLLEASKVIAGSCHVKDDKSRRYDHLHIGSALRSYKYFAPTYFNAYTNETLEAWLTWIQQQFDQTPVFSSSEVAKITALPHWFSLSRDERFSTFFEKTRDLVAKDQSSRREEMFVERLDALQDDFKSLITLYQTAQTRGDIDLEVIAKGLDFYWLDAAEQYALESDNAREAIYMAAFTQQYGEGESCPSYTGQNCRKIVSLFDKRLALLTKEFINEEKVSFATLTDEKRSLDHLRHIVSYEREFRQKYGIVSGHRNFEEFNAKREKYRQNLQKHYRRDIKNEIKDIRTEPLLNDFVNHYFVEGDLEEKALKPI
ncbi:MAG: hypothetical protein AAF603_07760, partial [Pseudomonadota bacterium]